MNNLEIEELKKQVSFFIGEVGSMKKSIDNLINELSTGNEVTIVEQRIGLLKQLSSTLTLNSTIEESLEIKYLMEEISKMIFDFDYIIESDSPGYIIPTIDEIVYSVVKNEINVYAAGINDPQNRFVEGIYTLSTGEKISTQNISDQVTFNEVDPGVYSIIGEFLYQDINSVEKIIFNLENIVVEDEITPPATAPFLIEFKNGEYTGGGEITITNNSDDIVTSQWDLKFNTAFTISGENVWGDYAFPTTQKFPHGGVIEEDGMTILKPNTVWWPEDSFDIENKINPNETKVIKFNIGSLEEGNEVTECYFNGKSVDFNFDMDGDAIGGGTTPPGSEDITISEIDDIENKIYSSQMKVKINESNNFTIIESGNYNFIVTNNEVAEISISGQIISIRGKKPGRTSVKIYDGSKVRYIGLCILESTGMVPGFPDYLSLGTMRLDVSGDLDFWFDYTGTETEKNKRQDANYLYINGGADAPGRTSEKNNWKYWGYPAGSGSRVTNYIKSSMKLGTIPTFIWYNIPDGGESYTRNKEHMQDKFYMTYYFKDLMFFLDLIKETGQNEMSVVILEPDFLGYMAQNGETIDTYAAVDAAYEAGALDPLEDSPSEFTNTLDGLVKAINRIISKHQANIKFGWKINLWARPTGGYVHNHNGPICKWTDHAGDDKELFNNYRDDIYEESVKMADYYINMGIQTYGAGIIAIDKYGLDGAAPALGPETNVKDPAVSQWFWNAEHHNNYLTFTGAMHDQTKLPVILWQMTVGHINGTTEINPYSTDGSFSLLNNTDRRYECSTSPYFFGDTFDPRTVCIGDQIEIQGNDGNRFKHFSKNVEEDPKIKVEGNLITWKSHLQETVDAGVVMIMSGAGVGISTHNGGNAYEEDLKTPTDNHWWITKTQKYYEVKTPLSRKLKIKLK